ncbi:peroxidase isoform X2 [Anabrus simplex]|uniref:peroxidase isoform X2 n=1 Tax=Anabrus simplex TaxID=316456 RepID=UPI0035A3AB46
MSLRPLSAVLVFFLQLLMTDSQPPLERECAVRLGPGLAHGVVYNGVDGGCISYGAVDEAFLQAREKVGLRRPLRDNSLHSLSLLGTSLQETTRILADRFRLSREEISSLLPKIDTTNTRISSFCPRFLEHTQPCTVTRYRRYDGTCNNLQHPTWGAAKVAFRRLLPPNYADGVSEPRAGRNGFPLPNPRSVSAHVHRDGEAHDHAVTFLFVAWGQLLDHDLTFTAETKDPNTRQDPDCCRPQGRRHPNCLAVELPPDDRFYRQHKQSCMNLLRSLAGVRDDCRLGPRVQMNSVTSFIDASFVYGSDARTADSLRLLRGGRLRTLPMFKKLGLKDLLPLKVDYPDDGCIRPDPDIFCFLAGDNRVNEQLVLAVLHTVLVREHNRIATELSEINPHWDDEQLYQETRHIIAALVQHITYTEFLPMLLGRDAVRRHDLTPLAQGYYDGYDADVDATMTASFITAAFRFGHSLLPSRIERWSATHKHVGSQRLSEVLKQPFDLYKPGWLDQYVMGLVNQVPQAMDDAVTPEVTNHLFQKPTHHYGMDLASINVQRAREHGVPGYADYRRLCGLGETPSWSSMLGVVHNHTIRRYHDIYDHPDDVDLWSAGVSERPSRGSMVGPTFSCIIARTFRDLRRGDRFWYENKGWPSAFTPAQLQQIRQIRLSRILCDAGDELESMQVYAMALPDPERNPRVSCTSRVLPRLDLSKWRDRPSPAHQHHKPVRIKCPHFCGKLRP